MDNVSSGLSLLNDRLVKFSEYWQNEKSSENYNVSSGDHIPYMISDDGSEWGGYNHTYDYERTKFLLLYLYSCGYRGFDSFSSCDVEGVGQLREEIRKVIIPVLESSGVSIISDDEDSILNVIEDFEGELDDDTEEEIKDFFLGGLGYELDEQRYVLSLFVKSSISDIDAVSRAANLQDLMTYVVPSFTCLDVCSVPAILDGKEGVFLIGTVYQSFCYSYPFSSEDCRNLIIWEGIVSAIISYREWEMRAYAALWKDAEGCA